MISTQWKWATFLSPQNAPRVSINVMSLVASIDYAGVEQRLRDVLLQHKVTHSENRNLTKEGSEILCEWINTPFRDIKGKDNFILCMAREITEQKRLKLELEQAAHYDTLTSLPNRALIIELIKQTNTITARRNAKFAVLFLDLNDFKAINDTLGHNSGDRVLQSVADRLSQGIGGSDYAGRLAGDEFLIILQDIDTQDSVRIAVDKLAELIAKPLVINGETLSIKASIGISIYPDHAQNIDMLMQLADSNMYQIKRKTKSSVQMSFQN